MSLVWESVSLGMRYGLPRQSADWLAMTETNVFSDGRGSDKMVGVFYGAQCAPLRGVYFFDLREVFFWLLICWTTSERPPISGFLFRLERELESAGPAKLFDRFGGVFPGKTWGKHLLQRPPTGAKFRQLRLFPYHLKSAGSDTVPVRVRSAAPRRKNAAAFRFRGFRKSRENSIFAASFLLLPAEARFGGVPFFIRGLAFFFGNLRSKSAVLPDATAGDFS